MKKLTILQAAVHATHNYTIAFPGNNVDHDYDISINESGKTDRYETDLHGNVNVLLGGAMLSGVIVVVVLMCYCCHRNVRKNRPQEYPRSYCQAEPDVHSLEVFTMDSQARRYDHATSVGVDDEGTLVSLPLPATPGPPPAYESLVFESVTSHSGEKKESPKSPTNVLPVSNETAAMHYTKNDENRRDDEGLPSYEAALHLEAHGYL